MSFFKILIFVLTIIVVSAVIFVVMKLTGTGFSLQRSEKSSSVPDGNQLANQTADPFGYEYGFENNSSSQAAASAVFGSSRAPSSGAPDSLDYDSLYDSKPVNTSSAASAGKAANTASDKPQTLKGKNYSVSKLNCGGVCKLCNKETAQLYGFTLSDKGKNSTLNMCADCSKKLISKLRN